MLGNHLFAIFTLKTFNLTQIFFSRWATIVSVNLRYGIYGVI